MKLNALKLNEIYEVEIIGLENEGSGVCKVNGVIVFVPKALIGEKVRIRITEIKKNFARAKLIKIISKSNSRITPKCPYYDECGGCNLRHQDSEENLKFKKNKIENVIKRIGKLQVKVSDVLPSLKNDNYRNKASFKVENDKIGFYEEGTYRLIDIDNCLLLSPSINNALEIIKEYIGVNNNSIKNINIKCGNALDEVLIDIYSIDEKDISIKEYLINNIKNLKTIIFNGNIIYGDGYIKQISNGLMFYCSAKSFFQVNSIQTEKLYDIAIKHANLCKDDVVLDLYCGIGTISCIVASHVKKVIGIEIVKEAINDANNNLKINSINNIKFICGDASKEITKIKEKIDVIFVDPPRAGLTKMGMNIIKKICPKKLIYISCNPVTLARDLEYMNDIFDVKNIFPVDMFPNTSHCESVCVLERR